MIILTASHCDLMHRKGNIAHVPSEDLYFFVFIDPLAEENAFWKKNPSGTKKCLNKVHAKYHMVWCLMMNVEREIPTWKKIPCQLVAG